jgi:hypothetical protein
MWYNAPILYGDPDSPEMFPHYSGEILYNGSTPKYLAKELADELDEKVDDWFLLYFLYTLLLIGAGLVGYAVLRKFTK